MIRYSDIDLERDSTPEEIQRAADAVRAFEKTDGWLVLSRMIHRLSAQEARVLDGHPLQVGDYAMAGGKVQAYRRAMKQFDEIITKAKELSKNE